MCLEQGNDVFLANPVGQMSWGTSHSACLKLNSLPSPLNLHLCLLCGKRHCLCNCPRWKFDCPDPSFFITNHVWSVTKSYLIPPCSVCFLLCLSIFTGGVKPAAFHALQPSPRHYLWCWRYSNREFSSEFSLLRNK